MSAPRISCVVPVFNGECYLKEALESVLAQTLPVFEIIVVDDGSTDGTAEVIASFGNSVRYLYQANAGPAAARNTGVDASCGQFIAFLDADDLWHPEKLACQVARFAARADLHLSVAHVQNFWIPELTEEAQRLRGHRITQAMPGYVTSALLARRALFETVGAFDRALRHGSDADWFLRAQVHGAVSELLPQVLTYRRLHHTNLSRLAGAASHDEFLGILKAHLDRRRSES